MASEREVVCVHYKWEGGECAKGREGTFRKICQTCKKYKAKKGSLPARQNLKRQKIEKIREHDMKQMMRDY